MNTNYWQDKRVLVTGADGFMGSHLTERLVELGAKVTVMVRGTSVQGTNGYSFKNIPELTVGKIENIICADIASTDTIQLVIEIKPEIIMHLAASAYVPFSFDHPLEVNSVNVVGTLNILEASRKLKDIQRIVCTSSSEVYGSAQSELINEQHSLNPTSPYAASKTAADRYCFSYINTYKCPVAIIRPFNTYGPRHTYDVVPKFIRQALNDAPLEIYGSGHQSRDLTYVTDMINAFILMGEEEKAIGKVINFGTGKDYSVNYIAKKIVELSGSKSEIKNVELRKAEVNRLTCDVTLAKKLLGWSSTVSFEDGLKKNIDWARNNWQ